MPLSIRDAVPPDAPVILGMVQELATSAGETTPLTLAYARQYLSASGGHVLLAEMDGVPVGMLSYSIRADLFHAAPTGLIEELVVRAEARGQGVGTVLVQELLQRLSSQGCAEVSVTTMPDNAGAVRFYRRLGLVDEAVYLEKHF
jgi:ribosomal protein S18 acetylase RimI-like enzyme